MTTKKILRKDFYNYQVQFFNDCVPYVCVCEKENKIMVMVFREAGVKIEHEQGGVENVLLMRLAAVLLYVLFDEFQKRKYAIIKGSIKTTASWPFASNLPIFQNKIILHSNQFRPTHCAPHEIDEVTYAISLFSMLLLCCKKNIFLAFSVIGLEIISFFFSVNYIIILLQLNMEGKKRDYRKLYN